MAMKKVYPLIICGGKGSRMWPISRTQSPKQFQKIGGPQSVTFFQAAVSRHRGALYHDPCIVTGTHLRGMVAQQLREIQSAATFTLCEPVGRNTGPAVLAAAYKILQQDPDAVFVVVPADHVIEGNLDTVIASCLSAAEAGHVITFGVKPRYAETGFGYITDGGPIEHMDTVRKVGKFVEKPPRDVAENLISGGGAFWASGISMFRADTIISEYETQDPKTATSVRASLDLADHQPEALYLDEEQFSQARSQPTESAVFENTDKIVLAPLDVEWNDVGSWMAMYGISKPDQDGNVFQGDVISFDAKNTMVRSEDRLVSIVGVSDVIVIDTVDALLITRMDKSQNVKNVVSHLKAAGRAEADCHADPKPAMIPVSRPSQLEPLVKSQHFDLGTAQIDVGRGITLGEGSGQQAIVVRGAVFARGPNWQKIVREGGRVYADENGPVRIDNCSDDTTELLFVTFEALDVSPKSLPLVGNG